MTARLERILDKLAERHAPRLVTRDWHMPADDPIARIQAKARALAKHDLVVITGHLPPEFTSLKDLHVQDWVQCHYLFYHALVRPLFPSYPGFEAHHADRRLPPVVVLHGQATPVMDVLSGLVLPYIALRQGRSDSDDNELSTLMDTILEALAADDLPHDPYRALHGQGVDLLRRLLNTSIQHVSLTTFDHPEPDWLRPQAAPRPSTLPEESQVDDKTAPELLAQDLETLPEDNQPPEPTREMFIHEIMIGKRKAQSSPPPGLPGTGSLSAHNQDQNS